MKKLMILATLVGVFAMVGMANAQGVTGEIGVSFDEAGTLAAGTMVPGSQLDFFVVAFGLNEIFGYEFEVTPTVAPDFLLGKDAYGPAPQDFGTGLEVRAGTGGCVNDPTLMGPDAGSWTLTVYHVLYFAPVNDLNLCVGPSPGSGASTPQYTICDANASIFPLLPTANQDPSGITPVGCAVANPTQGQTPVGAETTTWGSLKAGF